MTIYGSIIPPHQHSFIVSNGVRICSTCGAYPADSGLAPHIIHTTASNG